MPSVTGIEIETVDVAIIGGKCLFLSYIGFGLGFNLANIG